MLTHIILNLIYTYNVHLIYYCYVVYNVQCNVHR